MRDTKMLVKIKNVVGFLYIPNKPTQKAIIHAKGGPSFSDEGNSPIWPIAKEHGYILFVPDYIGSCRSDGVFNFKNCINTFYESEDFLNGKLTGTNPETLEKIKLTCSDIILIGSSWGGAMVPFIGKYRKSSIKTIGLIKAVTDWTSQGKTKFKETDVTLTNQLIKNGWNNIYRGYSKSEWPKIFQGKTNDFNPLNQTQLMHDKTVIITHGKQDTSVNWHKSLLYYKELKKQNPNGKYFWKLIDDGHTGAMNAKGVEFILDQLKKITDKPS